MQRQKLCFRLTDFPPQAAAQPLTHDHLRIRKKRRCKGESWQEDGNQQNLCRHMDPTGCIAHFLFHFYFLLYIHSCKSLKVRLCPALALFETAEHHCYWYWCLTLSVTFRKKNRAPPFIWTDMEMWNLYKRYYYKVRKGKGLECHSLMEMQHQSSSSEFTEELMASDTACLACICSHSIL